MENFDVDQFADLNFDSEFETFLGLGGVGLPASRSAGNQVQQGTGITASTSGVSPQHGRQAQTHSSVNINSSQCPGCRKYQADINRLDQDHRINFRMLKQKVTGTDLLIRRFQAKKDEYELQVKTIQNLNLQLEKVTRDSTILSEQLQAVMKEVKPLKDEKEHLLKELEKKNIDNGRLRDRILAEEAYKCQRSALDEMKRKLEAEVTTLRKQNNTLSSKIHTLEHNTKELDRERKALKSSGNINVKRMENLALALYKAQTILNSLWKRFSCYDGLVDGERKPDLIPKAFKALVRKVVKDHGDQYELQGNQLSQDNCNDDECLSGDSDLSEFEDIPAKDDIACKDGRKCLQSSDHSFNKEDDQRIPKLTRPALNSEQIKIAPGAKIPGKQNAVLLSTYEKETCENILNRNDTHKTQPASRHKSVICVDTCKTQPVSGNRIVTEDTFKTQLASGNKSVTDVERHKTCLLSGNKSDTETHKTQHVSGNKSATGDTLKTQQTSEQKSDIDFHKQWTGNGLAQKEHPTSTAVCQNTTLKAGAGSQPVITTGAMGDIPQLAVSAKAVREIYTVVSAPHLKIPPKKEVCETVAGVGTISEISPVKLSGAVPSTKVEPKPVTLALGLEVNGSNGNRRVPEIKVAGPYLDDDLYMSSGSLSSEGVSSDSENETRKDKVSSHCRKDKVLSHVRQDKVSSNSKKDKMSSHIRKDKVSSLGNEDTSVNSKTSPNVKISLSAKENVAGAVTTRSAPKVDNMKLGQLNTLSSFQIKESLSSSSSSDSDNATQNEVKMNTTNKHFLRSSTHDLETTVQSGGTPKKVLNGGTHKNILNGGTPKNKLNGGTARKVLKGDSNSLSREILSFCSSSDESDDAEEADVDEGSLKLKTIVTYGNREILSSCSSLNESDHEDGPAFRKGSVKMKTKVTSKKTRMTECIEDIVPTAIKKPFRPRVVSEVTHKCSSIETKQDTRDVHSSHYKQSKIDSVAVSIEHGWKDTVKDHSTNNDESYSQEGFVSTVHDNLQPNIQVSILSHINELCDSFILHNANVLSDLSDGPDSPNPDCIMDLGEIGDSATGSCGIPIATATNINIDNTPSTPEHQYKTNESPSMGALELQHNTSANITDSSDGIVNEDVNIDHTDGIVSSEGVNISEEGVKSQDVHIYCTVERNKVVIITDSSGDTGTIEDINNTDSSGNVGKDVNITDSSDDAVKDVNITDSSGDVGKDVNITDSSGDVGNDVNITDSSGDADKIKDVNITDSSGDIGKNVNITDCSGDIAVVKRKLKRHASVGLAFAGVKLESLQVSKCENPLTAKDPQALPTDMVNLSYLHFEDPSSCGNAETSALPEFLDIPTKDHLASNKAKTKNKMAPRFASLFVMSPDSAFTAVRSPQYVAKNPFSSDVKVPAQINSGNLLITDDMGIKSTQPNLSGTKKRVSHLPNCAVPSTNTSTLEAQITGDRALTKESALTRKSKGTFLKASKSITFQKLEQTPAIVPATSRCPLSTNTEGNKLPENFLPKICEAMQISAPKTPFLQFGQPQKHSQPKHPVSKKRKLSFSQPTSPWHSSSPCDMSFGLGEGVQPTLSQIFSYFKRPRLLSPLPPSPVVVSEESCDSLIKFDCSTPSDVIKVTPLAKALETTNDHKSFSASRPGMAEAESRPIATRTRRSSIRSQQAADHKVPPLGRQQEADSKSNNRLMREQLEDDKLIPLGHPQRVASNVKAKSLSHQMMEVNKLIKSKRNASVSGKSKSQVVPRGVKRKAEVTKADQVVVTKRKKLVDINGFPNTHEAVMFDLKHFLEQPKLDVNLTMNSMLSRVVGGDGHGIWEVLPQVVVQYLATQKDKTMDLLLAACDKEEIIEQVFISEQERRLLDLLSALMKAYQDTNKSRMLSVAWTAIFSQGPAVKPARVSLCRLFTSLCKAQGDLEQARVLTYNIAWCGYLDLGSLYMAMAGVWPAVFSPSLMTQQCTMSQVLDYLLRDTYSSRPKVLKQVHRVLQKLCLWDMGQAAEEPEKLLKTIYEKLVYHFANAKKNTGYTFEVTKAIELLLIYKGSAWTYSNFVQRILSSLAMKWEHKGDTAKGPSPELVVAIMGVFRAVVAVQPLSLSSLKIIWQIFERFIARKSTNMPVELAYVNALLEISPYNPEKCLDLLRKWQDNNKGKVPNQTFSNLLQVRTMLSQKNGPGRDSRR